MKKFTFAPIAIFTLTMLLAGCSTQAPQTQDPVLEIPKVEAEASDQESNKESEIKHGNLVISKQCQDKCFGTLTEIIDAGGDIGAWDLKACQVACQTQIEIDAEKAGQ